MADLTDEVEQRLQHLCTLSPTLQRAYTLREELTTIFDTARSKADALRRMRFWKRRVERSTLSCFMPFLTLLDHATLSPTLRVAVSKG